MVLISRCLKVSGKLKQDFIICEGYMLFHNLIYTDINSSRLFRNPQWTDFQMTLPQFHLYDCSLLWICLQRGNLNGFGRFSFRKPDYVTANLQGKGGNLGHKSHFVIYFIKAIRLYFMACLMERNDIVSLSL